jgi:hypothetical protein
MTARKSFLLRISPALYEALEGWAQQELRSVNGQIEYLLKEAVRKRGGKLVEDKEAAQGEDSQATSQAASRAPE